MFKIKKRIRKKKNYKKKMLIHLDPYDKPYKPLIKGRERSSTISKTITGIPVRIHNGRIFRRFIFNKFSVGLKIGSLTFNRRPFHFPLRRKKR